MQHYSAKARAFRLRRVRERIGLGPVPLHLEWSLVCVLPLFGQRV